MRLRFVPTLVFAAAMLALTPAWAQDWSPKAKPEDGATPSRPAADPLAGTGCDRTGPIAKVIEACTVVLKDAPKNVDALALRGNAHRMAGDRDAAVTDISSALAIDPTNMFALGRRLTLRTGTSSEALLQSDVDAIFAGIPKTAADFEARGIAKSVRKDYDGAVREFSLALDLAPDDSAILVNRSLARTNLKQFVSALADAEKAAALNPEYGQAHFQKGVVHAYLLQFSAAVDAHSKAIAVEPGNATFLVERGRAHVGNRNLERAVADFDLAISSNPSLGSAYYYRASAHQDRNEVDKAIADYNTAIALNPKNASAYVRRAAMLRRKGDKEAGLTDLNRALELEPANLDGRIARAGVYVDRGELDKALSDADEAVKIYPKAPAAHGMRAFVLNRKTDFAGAIESAGTAIELGSKNSSDYANRSFAHFKLGRLDLAIADATKEIELAPRSTSGYDRRSALHTALGDADKAREDKARADALRAITPGSAVAPQAQPAAAKASTASPNSPTQAAPPPGSAPRAASNPAVDLVRAQLDRREYDLALVEADKIIVSDPRAPLPYLLRSEAYFGKRDMPRALADANKAIELNGSLFIAYAVRCELHLMSSKYDDALTDCNRAISIGPATAATYASRGAAYTQLKNYSAAMIDLDQSLQMRETAYARFYRGLALFHQKALDKAAVEFRKVLEINPNHQGAIVAMRILTSADKSTGKSMEVRLMRNADARCGDQCAEWISAEGDIDASTPDKFRAVLRTIGDRKLPVFINSPGGRIQASLDVGRLLRQRGLDVYVTRTDVVDCRAPAEVCRAAASKGIVFGVPRGKLAVCASACTNILAAGTTRSVGLSSMVGVHQAAYYAANEGEPKKATDRKIPDALYTRLKDYFVEMGVDSVVMLRMLATPHAEMYWFRREELGQTRLTTQTKSGEELVTGSETDDWMAVSPKAAAALTKGAASVAKPEAAPIAAPPSTPRAPPPAVTRNLPAPPATGR